MLAAAGPLRGGAQPSPTVIEALEKISAGDAAGALALLEPLGADPSATPQALALLGQLYISSGRAAEALALLAPLAEHAQAGPVVLLHAGRAAILTNEGARGERYLRRSLALAPGAGAARPLGIWLGEVGRLAEAYAQLEPWARAHPQDTEARLAAAFAAIELRRADDAGTLLDGLPDSPQARLLRGRLQLLRADPRGALATLEPLRASPPRLLARDLRLILAEIYLRLGNAGSAAELLADHTADDPAGALLLAQALQQAGEPAAVLATVQPFLAAITALAPEAPVAERRLHAALALERGRALVTLTRWEDAVASLSASTRLDQENPAAWQALGHALAGAGRPEAARRAIERFQEVARTHPGPDASRPPDQR